MATHRDDGIHGMSELNWLSLQRPCMHLTH